MAKTKLNEIGQAAKNARLMELIKETKELMKKDAELLNAHNIIQERLKQIGEETNKITE